MILDFDEPTTFDLQITNQGSANDFTFYTFFGILDEPKTKVHFDSGETKTVQLKIIPSYNLKPGYSTFDIFIRGNDNTEVTQELLVKVVNLEDTFEIGSSDLDPESNSLSIYIQNKVNYNFENMNVKFSSPFFNFEMNIKLTTAVSNCNRVKISTNHAMYNINNQLFLCFL